MGKKAIKAVTTKLLHQEAEASVNLDNDPKCQTVTEPPFVSPSITPKKEIPHGRIESPYWVWTDGRKTHLNFIVMAIRKMKSLPHGFYDEAERVNINNINMMAAKAKSMDLKDDVMEP